MHLPEVDTPALLLDRDQLERNIDHTARRAAIAGIALRPHAKAHKSPTIGALQVASGARGLCAAKLGEAEALADGGIADLLVTTPITGARKIARLVALARRARITAVCDDAANAAELSQALTGAGLTLDMLVDVDVGQARTGVTPGEAAALLATRLAALPGLRFRGLQGYQGRLQGVASYYERKALVGEAMAKLATSRDAVRAAGLECTVLSGGGTGSFPIDLELKLLTELQPGSYVTMDSNYAKVDLGTPAHSHGHPLTILTSVISRPTAERAVVDVGWKCASSDSGVPIVKGRADLVFEFAGDEHGIVRAAHGALTLAVGDRLELIPSHCDTTVNLYERFVMHRGGRLEGELTIAARGRSQ